MYLLSGIDCKEFSVIHSNIFIFSCELIYIFNCLQRFCQINNVFIEPLEKIFIDSYATVHRLETNKLRNVARFFAHLLFTDSISWVVLSTIHLNEEETTSSSRIYIKILFQELAEHMGLNKLNARVQNP